MEPSTPSRSLPYDEALFQRLEHACMQMVDPGKEYALRMTRADWMWLYEVVKAARSETASRSEIIEECAAACEHQGYIGYDGHGRYYQMGAHDCAKAIRALKEIAPCVVCGQRRVACGENTACPGRMPR